MQDYDAVKATYESVMITRDARINRFCTAQGTQEFANEM